MVIITVVVFYILLSILDNRLKCNMPSIVHSVCSAYNEGQVSGPLCPDLCEQNNIQFDKCLSTVIEKSVYDGEWRGKQVILKMKMDWFELFEKEQKTDILSSYPDYISFRVETLFGSCPQCDKLKSRLLKLCDSNCDGIITISEVRTFVSLLRLLEPMMLITLNESQHSVDFYGYCGGLYVLEKMPFIASQVFGEKWELRELSLLPDMFEPLEEFLRIFAEKIVNSAFTIPYLSTIISDVLTLTKYHIFSVFFQTYVPSDKEKFEFLYSILDATLGVSNGSYGVLQSCDLHLGNYGFTDNSVVKVIDFDHTYPVTHLGTIFEQRQCASDDDCWVGNLNDCQSSCNTSTGTCEAVVWRHDLINICESQLPFVFRSPVTLLKAGQNTTCLKKAIKKLVLFCQQMPGIQSFQQLREAVLEVKGKLQYIESSCVRQWSGAS